MLDCKDVAGLVFGSLLCHIATLRSVGPNTPERLAKINRSRLQWYRRHPNLIVLPKIKETNLRTDGWGELNGPAFKAAITRTSAGFFKAIAHEFLTSGTEEEACMIRLVDLLHAIYDLLWNGPRFLPGDRIGVLRRYCVEFGENYMWCREYALLRNVLLWRVTGKVHKMQHLPAMASIINPAWVSCYAEESSIETSMRVWKQCMHGKYRALVQRNVLLKRLCGLLLRVEGVD